MTKITWKKAVISIVSLLVILVMYKTAVFNGVSSVLYYNIAKNNVDARKLYTNVIGLFNTWKRASMKQRKRVIFGTRNVIIKGSMSDELK